VCTCDVLARAGGVQRGAVRFILVHAFAMRCWRWTKSRSLNRFPSRDSQDRITSGAAAPIRNLSLNFVFLFNTLWRSP
jgi:hypothetical protein